MLVDEEIEGSELASVVSDNEQGGRLAAEHLLGLGHRSALVLGVDGVVGTRRMAGFGTSWSAGGGEPLEFTMGSVTAESGRACIAPYVERIRSGEFSAVFAGSDLMALGAIELLREHGLSVPGDVSFVGFDDSPDARYSSPRLDHGAPRRARPRSRSRLDAHRQVGGNPDGRASRGAARRTGRAGSAGPFVPARNKGTESA